MGKISVERTIDFPASRIWEALRNFGGIQNFHPQVRQSPLLNGQSSGVGAERKCEFFDGNWVNERVTAWDEGRSLSLDIYDGSIPVRDARATITLVNVDADRTTIRFDMAYVPKMGPLGKIMDALMMRAQFTKVIASVLAGLETHVRTGGVVGRDGLPESRAELSFGRAA